VNSNQLETLTYSDSACSTYITTTLKPFSFGNCTNLGTTGGLWYNATVLQNATQVQILAAKKGFKFPTDTITK